VRRKLLVAALVTAAATLSFWRTGRALGDNRPAGSASSYDTRVALVDLAYVFKKYDKFNRLSEQMKADVKAKEAQVNQAQQEIKQIMEQRSQLAPDSTTAKEKDALIVQKRTSLEVMTNSLRQEFTQREATIYHQTYQEVEAVIKDYAEKRGISLVLRAARDDDKAPTNPQDVIKEVSQQVIYSLPQMDITEDILNTLNRSASVAGPKGGTPSKTGPAQPAPRAPSNTVKKPSTTFQR
jgi:Skp family chaperone for outer membrane proteins